MAVFLKPRWGSFYEDKEYLSYQLLEELDSTKTYCFSLFTSLADGYTFHTPNEAFRVSAIKEIHVLFEQIRPDYPTMNTISQTPSIILKDPGGDFLKDTLGWMFLRKPFTAAGGEQYFTIGNFTSTNEIEFLYLGDQDTLSQDGSLVSYGDSYYYFDDISLVEIEDVNIIDSSTDLVLTRPYTLQAQGWAEEYHWSTLENPNTVIATGNPATVILSDSTNGFILHARNCEVDQYDTVFVSSIAPPPLPAVIIPGLSIEQNVHKEFFKITYIAEQAEPLNVFLYNSAGQLVATQIITSSLDFTISNFAQGIYYCRIFKGSVPALTEKIVVLK